MITNPLNLQIAVRCDSLVIACLVVIVIYTCNILRHIFALGTQYISKYHTLIIIKSAIIIINVINYKYKKRVTIKR